MRKYIVVFGSLLAAIFFFQWLYHYLHTSTLIIISSPSSSISLTKTDDTKFFIDTVRGKLSITVKDGEYLASVQQGTSEAHQLITLSGHKTVQYQINLSTPVGDAEPVAEVNAKSISAGDSLRYVDSSVGFLYQIDGQNNTVSLSSNQGLQSVQWVNPSEGIAQDKSGSLYMIKDGSVKRLKLPTPYANYYALSPSGELYISYGKIIYKSSAGGAFTKLYTSKVPFTSMSASKNGVALINSLVGDATVTNKPYVTIIKNSGGVIKKGVQASDSARWSPDGTYFATLGSTGYKVFDKSLNVVTRIPNTEASNLLWLDNTRLMYTVNNELWTLNIATERSDKFAIIPGVSSINELSLDIKKSYVYLSVASDSGTPSIKRVALQGQKIPDIVYQLNDLLPETVSEVTLSLTNFGSVPSVVVNYSSNIGDKAALQIATTELQSNGFDLGQIKLLPVVTPID